MAAFIKIQGIDGEATDSKHKNWVIIQSLSAPIFRSIPEGARDQQRSRGETTLGDVVVVRETDKSTVQLQQACANGTFYPEVEIHLCTTVKDAQEPYMVYKLKDVILTSFAFHGSASGDPLPTEEITMNYTKVEWDYTTIDPATGNPGGHALGSYSPGEGRA